MFTFALEFEEKNEVDKVIKKLKSQYGVTGELHVQPVDNGKWRLTVYSEKNLRETTIEKLGQVIELA